MRTTSASQFSAAALAIFFVLWAGSARATQVLYEGFDYGGSGSSLGGLGSAGSGWAGSWGTYSFTYTGSPTFVEDYEPGGLTFSDLPVSGGNAFVSSSGDGGAVPARQHSTTIVGDVWGSFLFQRTTTPSSTADFAVSVIGGPGSPSGFGSISVFPDEYAQANGAVYMVDGSGSNTTNSGTAISTGTTYLVLFKATNMGAAAGTQSLTDWILTEDQYDNFKSGGVTEAELNSAGLGTGATDVLQRGTTTKTGASNQFASGSYIMLESYYFNAGGRFDELRISDASLAEVLTVPEPSAWLLAMFAAAGVARLVRRGAKR